MVVVEGEIEYIGWNAPVLSMHEVSGQNVTSAEQCVTRYVRPAAVHANVPVLHLLAGWVTPGTTSRTCANKLIALTLLVTGKARGSLPRLGHEIVQLVENARQAIGDGCYKEVTILVKGRRVGAAWVFAECIEQRPGLGVLHAAAPGDTAAVISACPIALFLLREVPASTGGDPRPVL